MASLEDATSNDENDFGFVLPFSSRLIYGYFGRLIHGWCLNDWPSDCAYFVAVVVIVRLLYGYLVRLFCSRCLVLIHDCECVCRHASVD